MALAPFVWGQERPAILKIDKVEFIRLEGQRSAEKGVNGQYQVNPLHVYDALRPKEYRDGTLTTAPAKVTALYLRIATAEGVSGLYGPSTPRPRSSSKANWPPSCAAKIRWPSKPFGTRCTVRIVTRARATS